MINIDQLILSATKEQNISKRECYKMIKAKFQEWFTSKANARKVMDDLVQISILKKLKAEYEEDAAMYRTKASGHDIAVQYEAAAKIISELIPKEAGEDEINAYIDEVMAGASGLRMCDVIGAVKMQFPGTDGKIVATLVKARF